ncbi:MAG: Gfo/Idh/MocA family oxidoreductase, partial [Planctomycetes bacterium]|nr:Gfo/Idh/MocA family oxidoreductase [Planctomycetota bacterium]
MPEQARIALVGCGGWSRNVNQKAIARCDNLRVVACYDVDADEARQSAEAFDARACASYEDVLATDEVQAVLLMTPNDLHRSQLEAAFAAGKDVFVEKPIANTTADGLAMVRAAEASGRLLMVGHNTRRKDAMRMAQRWVAEGRIGRLLGCDAQFSGGTGLTMGEKVWRADPDRCPGLPLIQLGIHIIDVMNMLMGTPRQVAAIHRRAFLERNNDCTVSIIAYDEPLTATLTSHYVVDPAINSMRVMGTAGIIEITHHHHRIALLGSESKVIESHVIDEQ